MKDRDREEDRDRDRERDRDFERENGASGDDRKGTVSMFLHTQEKRKLTVGQSAMSHRQRMMISTLLNRVQHLKS